VIACDAAYEAVAFGRLPRRAIGPEDNGVPYGIKSGQMNRCSWPETANYAIRRVATRWTLAPDTAWAR